MNRSLGVPQIQAGGAQGNVGGDQFISAGELGYRVAFAPAAVFSPFVGFQVNTFDQDRVQETGLGPLNLNVGARDFLSARTLVGGRLETATTALGGRPVSLWVKAAYVHDFADVNLGCVGDGGAVLTDDPALARRLRRFREYGFADGVRISRTLGFNSRLDAIQAAIPTMPLPHLDAGNRERRAIAGRYRAALSNADPLTMQADDPGSVHHQFAIAHPARGDLAMALADRGIGTAIHYDPGLHRHPAFANAAPLPVTDRLAASLLSLPVQSEVAGTEAARIAAAVREAISR